MKEKPAKKQTTKTEKPAKKNGRPTIYTKVLGLKICQELMTGRSLRNICEGNPDMPAATTVHQWVLEDKKENELDETELGFSKQYARARDIQAENMFDEILDIADDGTNDYMTVVKGNISYNTEDREVTNRSRLRVDSRKWYLSKVLPKKFGDSLDLTSKGEAIKGNSIILKDFKTTESE